MRGGRMRSLRPCSELTPKLQVIIHHRARCLRAIRVLLRLLFREADLTGIVLAVFEVIGILIMRSFFARLHRRYGKKMRGTERQSLVQDKMRQDSIFPLGKTTD